MRNLFGRDTMSYRLIIADDEAHIRDGLSEMVDWKQLGFHIADKLEDGQQVIDSLTLNPVDAILTDIQMPRKTGLDVAMYVFQNRLPIKIVLISGYREFEFAKQAVNYNVNHYLLKPTRLNEISEVFKHVKQQLDDEQSALVRIQASQMRNDNLALSLELDLDDLDHFPADLSYAMWIDLQRTLFSYLKADNFEKLTEQFQILMNEAIIRNLPLRALHNFLIELFSAINRKLESREQDFAVEIVSPYKIILTLQSPLACKNWGMDKLAEITNAEQKRLLASQPSAIAKAKTYVALHFKEEISLKTIANHVHLSPDYFSRIFKQFTGYSFTDYVLEVRMNQAMDDLKNHEMKIYEIGERIGYANPKYFFKMFKRHTGFTPSEYRKTLTRKSDDA